MPLNKRTTLHFHRILYATELETVTLLKRNQDMNAGIVTSYKMYDCRWGQTIKTGEPLQADMLSNHRRAIHIPRLELKRIGIQDISPLDRFIDVEGRYWQPEATTHITLKLWENHMCIDCLRVDPPVVSGG